MKKRFDISLFYSNDLSEFDKWVEAKLAYLNTKLDHELRYTRNEEFVSIGNEFCVTAFRTSVEVQAFLDGIHTGILLGK